MIRLENVHLNLPGFALQGVNLHIREGEFFCLLGPTGSGKTLILETVAGLMRPGRGAVYLDGEDVTMLPPERRHVGIVYQDHALFPHLSVLENIRFGLRYNGGNTPKAKDRVDGLINLLGLGRLLHRKTARLSGGERQRVSLARALAVEPKVLLLDEPLSALDPGFREDVRRSLKQLHKELGITFLLVTHDFAEALFLADRVTVVRQGRLEHVGPTEEVFQRPATPFVAEFVGMKNIFSANLSSESCSLGGLCLPLPPECNITTNCTGHMALRPEDIMVRADENFPEGFIHFPGSLERIENLGTHWQAQVRCRDVLFAATLSKRALFNDGMREGAPVYLGFAPDDLHILVEE